MTAKPYTPEEWAKATEVHSRLGPDVTQRVTATVAALEASEQQVAYYQDLHPRAERAEAERDKALAEVRRLRESRDMWLHAAARGSGSEKSASAAVEEALCERDEALAKATRLREVLEEVRAWRLSATGLAPPPATDPETLGRRIDEALKT